MHSGDLVKVESAILNRDQVFGEFHPNWIAFADQIDGKLVKLKQPHTMFHAPDGILSEVCFSGWLVDIGDYQILAYNGKKMTPGSDFANWLPAEWLAPVKKHQTSLFA